ncbi:SprT family zinc-dependent metalloprotease [Campylobacter sp. MIT 21-1685]|uniref:M48 family metallopeptidase n=1 Tax=unclassified Campylobacter TaxID=2593542 RepID=UPI00224B9429|nr:MULTISPECIES: SprT family zinc-dependent metalloprotease [unclassified Campylobacter]MCX2682277.1 SprT family zinc-dependent metalloprotease [Campylobacter sp. MIT 21-1684]MCX2750557.1 SprT family zinc-dependent metalloprotease [Campylobacter sp. MIT 21-1682]MCX2806895.1 SprT family zinc-dependent metalloprotease [Campylobacter sp. MIT 21-1685]
MAKQKISAGVLQFFQWEIFYQRKSVKNLLLKLNEEGEFHLNIPKNCSQEKVFAFLTKNTAWMEKIWQNYQNIQARKQENEMYFLGKKYNVIIDANFCKTRWYKNSLQSTSKECLERFLKMNARIIFGFYLKKWSMRTGLCFTHLSIKKMRTRWGSCNVKKAYINLNIRLLEKSLQAIEYVILHELAHLKYANHSKEFYQFIEGFMSDFRQREKEF